MNKALRRHLTRRKIEQRKRKWGAIGIPYANWMKTTGTICSCYRCKNPRRIKYSLEWRLTPQELRALENERQQLRELSG